MSPNQANIRITCFAYKGNLSFLFDGMPAFREIIDQIFLPPIIALTVFEGKAVCSIFILLHLVNRRGRLVFGYKWRDRIFFYRCAGLGIKLF